jgi:hypothetical protein
MDCGWDAITFCTIRRLLAMHKYRLQIRIDAYRADARSGSALGIEASSDHPVLSMRLTESR